MTLDCNGWKQAVKGHFYFVKNPSNHHAKSSFAAGMKNKLREIWRWKSFGGAAQSDPDRGNRKIWRDPGALTGAFCFPSMNSAPHLMRRHPQNSQSSVWPRSYGGSFLHMIQTYWSEPLSFPIQTREIQIDICNPNQSFSRILMPVRFRPYQQFQSHNLRQS